MRQALEVGQPRPAMEVGRRRAQTDTATPVAMALQRMGHTTPRDHTAERRPRITDTGQQPAETGVTPMAPITMGPQLTGAPTTRRPWSINITVRAATIAVAGVEVQSLLRAWPVWPSARRQVRLRQTPMQRAMRRAIYMQRCPLGVPTLRIPAKPTTIAAELGLAPRTVPMASTIASCRGRDKRPQSSGTCTRAVHVH
jgi:hypothetical protein